MLIVKPHLQRADEAAALAKKEADRKAAPAKKEADQAAALASAEKQKHVDEYKAAEIVLEIEKDDARMVAAGIVPPPQVRLAKATNLQYWRGRAEIEKTCEFPESPNAGPKADLSR